MGFENASIKSLLRFKAKSYTSCPIYVFSEGRQNEIHQPKLKKNSARFKKGDKKDINNCRGVSQHTKASRILARLLTDRLKAWAETLGLVNENQNGFRSSRFTADATQIKT